MVKRYEIHSSDDECPTSKRCVPYGEYVLYTDHDAEMREALTIIKRLVKKADVNCAKALYGTSCACVRCEANELLDKHRHYLDKGE